MRSSRYEARGKFGEHERCVRVARGVASRNSSFLSFSLLELSYSLLELLEATPRATLTHLSCSPNFPSASYLDERTANVWTSCFITFSTRRKIFFWRDLFADVMSVHNRYMKHARAIEFDQTNLLAYYYVMTGICSYFYCISLWKTIWNVFWGFHLRFMTSCRAITLTLFSHFNVGSRIYAEIFILITEQHPNHVTRGFLSPRIKARTDWHRPSMWLLWLRRITAFKLYFCSHERYFPFL